MKTINAWRHQIQIFRWKSHRRRQLKGKEKVSGEFALIFTSYAEGMWHNLRRGLFIIGESALLEWLEGLFFGVFSGSGPGWWASERLSATGGTARFGPGGRREGFFCKLSGGFFHSLPLASIIEKEKRSS